jgi:hypothetical protein
MTELLLLYQLICDVFLCCMDDTHSLKSEKLHRCVYTVTYSIAGTNDATDNAAPPS